MRPDAAANPASPRGGWTPLVPGEQAARLADVVGEIADDVAVRVPPGSAADPGLGNGLAGIAAFFAHLHRCWPDGGHDGTARRYLDGALDLVARVPTGPSLYGGFFGPAWAAAHVARMLPDDEAVDLEEIDEALLAHLAGGAFAHFDLITGLVGMAVYALERLPAQPAFDALALLARALERLAVRTDEGARWHTAPWQLPPHQRELSPEGHVDLGVAHGVPGVLPVLAAMSRHGVEAPRTRALYEEGARWLAAQRLPAGSGAAFPAVTSPRSGPSSPARLAWCYGELGVAGALHASARLLGDHESRAFAEELAAGAALRTGEEAGVVDACLCHGAAGNAHVFNRLFQASGDPRFADAARGWLDRSLELRAPGRGAAGFEFSTGTGERVPRAGVLEGASGIGLALLAAITPVEPGWDRILLLSLRDA